MKYFIIILLLSGIAVAQFSPLMVPVDPSAFTMGLNFNTNPWPSAPVGEFRFWDTTISGQNTQWYGLCPTGTQGQTVATTLTKCTWTSIDTWLALLKTHGVKKVMFTPGGTPAWASSNPSGACTHPATGACYPPANQVDLANFVTAMHQHVNSWATTNAWSFTIDWGCLNEPNGGFWYATTTAGYQALGTYCTTIYNAVHGFGTEKVGTPAMQGSAGNTALGAYLTANSNPNNYDTINFHAYHGGSVSGGVAAPEVLQTLVQAYQTTLSSYSHASGKPMWNEEFTWDSGSDSLLCDLTQEQAWVSRAYPLLLSNGVTKNGWYQWDNKSNGTLQATATTGYGCPYAIGITPAGVAYKNIQSWYIGVTFSGACSQSGTVWTCDATSTTGFSERTVWDTSGTSTYNVPVLYQSGTNYTVAGVKATTGATISIGQTAILLVAPTGGRTDCTLFVVPQAKGIGLTPVSPESFESANTTGNPGSVVAGSHVCFLGGSFTQPDVVKVITGGTAGSHTVIEDYGDAGISLVCNNTPNPASGDHNCFEVKGTWPNGPSYIDFVWDKLLTIDGNGYATNAFLLQGNHHITIDGINMCRNFTRACVATGGGASLANDYIQISNNTCSHNGYNPHGVTYSTGATSCYSLNQYQSFDNYAGAHNVIANNYAVGEFDSSTAHTDGNGIIIDLSSVSQGPLTLIVNNVVYGNGGRGIELNTSGANQVANVWVVNNTVYKNGLDLTMLSPPGSIVDFHSPNIWYVNNISNAWDGRSGVLLNFQQDGTPAGTNQNYRTNAFFGGAGNDISSTGLINENPLFVSPPSCDAAVGGQYDLNGAGSTCAEDPATLGTGLQVLSSSPTVGQGIDPSTIPGLTTPVINDLRKWVYKDILGNTRPSAAFSLGAYQFAVSGLPQGTITGNGSISGNGTITVQ